MKETKLILGLAVVIAIVAFVFLRIKKENYMGSLFRPQPYQLSQMIPPEGCECKYGWELSPDW